jgi:transcriptional regulator with XRE-family HTH domain
MPVPPQESALIEGARSDARISVREAARRAGISEGWWRQIAKGFQTLSGGASGPVRGPDETIARMAKSVGVTPDQLTGAGRDGAARELEEILRRESVPRLRTIAGLDADSRLDAYRRAIIIEREDGIPPRSDIERQIWDYPRMSEDEKATLAAGIRLVEDSARSMSAPQHNVG